jgi:(p)ppGpp synthase/HD superfamily hydrolase
MQEHKTAADHDDALERRYEGLIPDAIIFSFNAHAGQYRLDRPQQFIIHPIRMSEFLLRNFSHRKDLDLLRVAAILHDTVEDTWATEEKIREEFGEEIAAVVAELTLPEEEDKQKRLELHLKKLESMSDGAKIVKLADIFDNIVLSVHEDRKWERFIRESKEVLENLALREPDGKFDALKKEILKIIGENLDGSA